jgi:hypothetical protein
MVPLGEEYKIISYKTPNSESPQLIKRGLRKRPAGTERSEGAGWANSPR